MKTLSNARDCLQKIWDQTPQAGNDLTVKLLYQRVRRFGWAVIAIGREAFGPRPVFVPVALRLTAGRAVMWRGCSV